MAAAVRDRRLELGLTQNEAADRAGVSLATWRLLEAGGRERYQPLTVRRTTQALGWSADAVDRLLAGAGAEEIIDDAAPTGGDDPTDRPGDQRGVPAGLARKWRDLSADEQAKVQGFVDGLLANRRR